MTRESWVGQPTTARVAGGAFYYVDSPAAAAVEQMEYATTFRGKVMASWAALVLDPGCIEAHICRGRHAKDPELRMAYLKAAVQTGETLWGPIAEMEGEDMTWWGCAATRPYMRAIQALGLEYFDTGDELAARQCFTRLLDMNPFDNQGIRHTLAMLESNSVLRPG